MVKYGQILKSQNTILSAAFVIALAYGVSAVLGLIKSRLLATYFGSSLDLSVYYLADRVPSFIFSIFALGTLASAFIPIFSEQLNQSKEAAFKFASNVISFGIVFFILLCLLLGIFSFQIINFMSAFKLNDNEILLGSNLMRMLLVSQIIFYISTFLSCVLQSFKRFLGPALAPVFYNLGIIAGLVFLSHKIGIFAPVVGSIVGAFMHFCVQAFFIRHTNFVYNFVLDFKDLPSIEMLKLIPMRVLTVVVPQITLTVNTILAVFVSPNALVYFRFADQLQSFPVNLFGVSVAFASLPSLSLFVSKKDFESLRKTFLNTFFQLMFLSLPASVIFLLLRLPLTRLVYGSSSFSWLDTLNTALLVGIFSFSIFPQCVSLFLTRVFYAFKDVKTPLITAFSSAFIAVGVAFVGVVFFGSGAWTLVFAFVLASILEMFLLLFFVRKKVGPLLTPDFYGPFAKIFLSSLAMGISIYAPFKILDIRVFDTTKTINLIALTLVVTLCGVISYLIFTKLFKVREIELFYKLVGKLRFKKDLPAVPPNI